jgi:hypothetical protein
MSAFHSPGIILWVLILGVDFLFGQSMFQTVAFLFFILACFGIRQTVFQTLSVVFFPEMGCVTGGWTDKSAAHRGKCRTGVLVWKVDI